MIRTPIPTLICWICVLAAACSSGKPVAVEQTPTVQAPEPLPTPVKIDVARSPKLSQVQDAIKRVFKGAATLHPEHNPNFLVGDFNGDASEDLAVILKPENLSEMNQELPPWLLRDPRSNSTAGQQQMRIQKDERLLAVIHGYGSNDWRDPEATQTFVLKNVVGNDLKVQSLKDFVSANTGRKLPRPQGDLIAETLNGTQGYLYYAVSTYSWYDPKTFRPQPEAGPFHKSRTMRAHAEKWLHAHAQKPSIPTITAEELKAKMNNNDPVTIIDVRGAEGYANSTTTIKGAFHFKLRRIKSRLKFAPLKDVPKDREIVTYCACPADEASISAAQTLQEAGFTRVRVLKGGWTEWLKAKGPVQPK
jgi:rhodanese-related sulfurtransferase